METFKFKWKRRFFWKTLIACGFSNDLQSDRLSVFLPDGGVYEIARWSKHDARLGSDFFAIQKKEMEKKAGQSIPTNNVASIKR